MGPLFSNNFETFFTNDITLIEEKNQEKSLEKFLSSVILFVGNFCAQLMFVRKFGRSSAKLNFWSIPNRRHPRVFCA